MKIDDYGCVVMEKDGMPGDLGDSCAETGRLAVLSYPEFPSVNLWEFVTPTGFIRHPEAPASAPGTGDNWREPDFSSDQMLPLLMAADLYDRVLFQTCAMKIRTLGYRVAPKKIAAPGVIFLINGCLTLFAITLLVQCLLFKFPYRWNDGHGGGFEKTEGSTADWLNYFVGFMYLRAKGVTWPLRFLDVPKALSKAESYYESQPNSRWFVGHYAWAALNKPKG